MALMNEIDSLHGQLTFLYPTVNKTVCPTPGIDRIARVVCRTLGADGNNVSTIEVESPSARGVILDGCQGNETDVFQCVQISGKKCLTAVWVNCGVSGFVAPEKNIFLASSGAVYSISINGSHKTMVPLAFHPSGLAYNAQTQQLFHLSNSRWIHSSLYRVDLNKMSTQRYMLESVTAITLDPISNLIYYASIYVIGVVSADFTRQRVLIDTDLSYPFAITLNIKQGFIFWIKRHSARIERAYMDGSSRKSIITTSIYNPSALYYDIQGNYLYWTDLVSDLDLDLQSRIYRCRSDGSSRTILFSTSLDLIDLVVDDKYLYAAVGFSKRPTTAQKWYLWKGLKDGSGGLSHFGVDETETTYFGMALNVPSAHATESSCASPQNGGCPPEAMCLPAGVTAQVCMCSEGLIYNSNMRTCQRNYTIQLVDGTDPSNGRVVVNYKGENRSVCIDYIVGNEVAMVVCRMLGFGDANAKLEASGTGRHRFWRNNVLCNGDEADITACQGLMVHWTNCPLGNSLRVSCRPLAFSMELVDGPDSWHGRVHLKRAGQEGGLCFTPDIMVAKVICQTLGYEGQDISMQDYGDGMSSALLTVRTCHGNETSIENCSHGGWGRVFYCSSALGVNCGSPKGTTTTTPRPIGTGRLLFAEKQNSSIYSMDIQGGPHRLILSFSGTGQYVIGVAYNERTDVLFYATGLYQGSGSRIGLINVRGGQHEEISRARGLRSIKVDPVSNLLFYATYTTIGVVSTDLRWSRLILEQGLTAVGDLALNPYEGTIFWTDAGLRAAAIGRASMDGSNFTRIISTNIDLPTALAIDIQGGLLYWFDYTTYYMYSCDQDGNNRRQLFRYSYEISAIAVDENYLYLGCQPFGYPFTSLSSLLSVRKSSTTPSAFGPIQNGEIVSMFLDKPTRYLSGSNVCSRTLNGGCGPLQLCLATGRNTRTCACQDGYIAVNLTCQRNFTMALMNGIDSLHGTLTFLYPTVNRTLCPSPGIDRIARAVCGILGADGNYVSTTEVGSSSAGVILHGCHSQGNETDIFQCVQIYGKSCLTAVWVNCGVSGFIAPEKNIFLASSEEGAIYSISINGSHKTMVPLTSHSKPRGLAYNAQTQQLFCSQSYGGVIDRIDLSKMSVQRHNFRKFGSLRAITLDPITNLVYYASEHAIGVVSADFTRHRVLIHTNFSNYMDITLNIKQGWIFWIKQRTPRIERAHMDGSSRQSIITTNITDPRALYYDIQGNYLYWIDVHSPTRIYRCRSDGSSRTLLFSTSLDLVDLVVDDKYLYAAVAYSHLTTKLWYLWKGLKDGSGGLSQFGVNETGTSYVGMALNVPSAHAQESACASRQNGGCPQEAMCLPTGVSTHVCMCFEGFIYNSNMKTCQRNYTVQLVDGTDTSNGRVVVNYKGENRSVCIDNVIGNEVAMVVCRMLGFGDTYAKLEAFGTDIHRFWLHNVLCNGDEADIAACKHMMWGDWNTCHHGNSLSVSCRPLAFSMELVDGPDSWHGRVHVKRAGHEGGLCYTPDIMVAKVICHTLGYEGADISMQDYGDGKGSALLNVRTCQGNETSIENCSHDGWGRVFYCSSALGVNCGSPKEPKVALVGGWDAHHGRVEVTYQKIIGSICRENLYQNEAEMICRMVGYRGGQVKTSMSYGQGNGPSLVGGLKCFGNASRTIECSHRGWRPDSGSRCTDVGIDCGPVMNTLVSARLVDGEDELHGRVQVEVSNSTLQGSLCELSTLFGDNQKKLAQVVCKNLGYRGEDVEAWLYPSNTSFIASNLMCTGNETGLRQCRNPEHWGNVSKECKPKNTLHIGCGKKEDDWKVWTEGGEDKYHGRIMVSYYGFNGTVCGSGFSENEAKVICRMLGYSGPMTNVRMTSAYGPASTDVILLDVLNCAGKEDHISQCFHRGVGVYSSSICDNQPPAGVSCGLTTYKGTCGVRSPVINKIFGGDIVDITTWPWMVSMQNASRHQCGGSIISDQWIVTAAHCLVKAEELLQTTVVVGTSNIFRVNKLEYKVSESYIHPSFESSIFSSAASSYDIALLKLEKKLEFTPSIRPICLNDVQDTLPEGPCYIIGWGKVHENTNAAHQLHEAMFRVVNDSICSDLTTSFYPENQICGGYAHGYRSICRGDSGGPLLCKRKGVAVYDLYGITSRGARCGGGSYNFFTDVSVFKSWIEATIN